jgi:hypothetical protein
MGRLVRPARTIATNHDLGGLEGISGGDGQQDQANIREPGDTYLERVAKYVPAEIIAFFIFANSILKQSLQPPGTMAGFSVISIAIIIFFAAWFFTPIYIWRVRQPGDAWILNAVIATLLFPVWAYAVEGVGATYFFAFDGHLASIILGAVSLASGLVIPKGAPDPPPPGQGGRAA